MSSQNGKFINDVLGIELTNYQLEFMEQMVRGRGVIICHGRRAGRATVRKVLREIYGKTK